MRESVPLGLKYMLIAILLLTYLSDRYDFSFFAPSGLLKKLWDLGCLPTSSLAYYNGDWKGLDQVQQTLTMSCDGQKARWFVKRRYERIREVEFVSHRRLKLKPMVLELLLQARGCAYHAYV